MGVAACLRPTLCRAFCVPWTQKEPARGPARLPRVPSRRRAACGVPGAILGERSRGVDWEPERKRLGPGMEMGRQITVLEVWAEEKGTSWNVGDGARFQEGAYRDEQLGGAGEIPHPPVATDQFELYSEGSRGRSRERGERGRKRGREEKKRKRGTSSRKQI